MEAGFASQRDPAPPGLTYLNIIDCAEWEAAVPTSPVTLTGRPDKIILHHSEHPNTADYSQRQALALAHTIQREYLEQGFIDCGVHFIISRGGYILEGRHRSLETLRGGRQMVIGSHCLTQNQRAIGISCEGNYTNEELPLPLYNGLIKLCTFICRQYRLDSSQIFGHGEFVATGCPGQLFRQLPDLRQAVKEFGNGRL